MSKKIRVGIVFGGRSAEHEVSVVSAQNVYRAIDKERFEVELIGIDQSGRWHLIDPQKFLAGGHSSNLIQSASRQPALAALPYAEPSALPSNLAALTSANGAHCLDVVFPVLHGTYGEDGTIQGFFKLAGIPFVGADVLGSAVGMDKDVMKRLLRDAGIAVAKFLVFAKHEEVEAKQVFAELGPRVFVKPANLGSSVGINQASNAAELAQAVQEAFHFDRKIIIEEGIEGREIECAVLGNQNPKASLPGEIIPHAKHGFYSYDSKYTDQQGAMLKVPAELPAPLIKKVQETALRAYKALCCEGLGRVDMFLKANGEVLLNEINTLPGFTSISMYPKMWEVSGLAYKDLISELIELALKRAEEVSNLKTSRA